MGVSSITLVQCYSGQAFERKGRFDLQTALKELDNFASDAEYILGHNILGHDLPVLESLAPNLRLLHKPVVDTLYLSPLAFPENPYHRLVKDYKLVRDSINDPVADARLAASVFVRPVGKLHAPRENRRGYSLLLSLLF